MNDILFLAAAAFFLVNLLGWGFKHLPNERWQMLAVVPFKKEGNRSWHGVNLTYYGFFIATSQLISVVLLLILLGSMSISYEATMIAVILVLLFSLPAARGIARIVEKKRHTFTIGGASFVGILVAPWAIAATNWMLDSPDRVLPTIPVLAAMSIAYTLGEGMGRLGCISFGCCYGKPLSECSKVFRYLFKRTGFIFYGDLKKVAYEGQLDGKMLIPIQAITCLLYASGALWGSYLFLNSSFTLALLCTIGLTQLWRIFSETLRADFRGFGKISIYQKMGLASVLYILIVTAFIRPEILAKPDILVGLHAVWDPLIIVAVQLLWVIFFFIFGRSTITTSTISFDLMRERI
jgi:hypothetical protein